MAIYARSSARQYTPCPEGLHPAVCVDVVDLGDVDTAFGRKHRVRLAWQIAEIDPATKHRFDVVKTYTLSLHARASLRQDLESWRGRRYSENDARQGIDLERLTCRHGGEGAHLQNVAFGDQLTAQNDR